MRDHQPLSLPTGTLTQVSVFLNAKSGRQEGNAYLLTMANKAGNKKLDEKVAMSKKRSNRKEATVISRRRAGF